MPGQDRYGRVMLIAGLSVLIAVPTIKAVPRGARPLHAGGAKVVAIPAKDAPRDLPFGDMAKGQGFDASGVTLSSLVPVAAFGGNASSANDVWGYVSPSGREYAIIGLNRGTGFVEVTDPFNPIVLANIPDAPSIWSDIAVYDQYAYNVNENSGGLQVIDLTQIDSGLVSLVREVTSDFSSAHNVVVNTDSGFAYPCGTNTFAGMGFFVYDLADPSNPQEVGSWNEHSAHDLYVVSYDACPVSAPYPLSGLPCEIVFVFAGSAGLYVVDVTDKSNITTISGPTSYPNLAYCHQGGLTEDRKHLLIDDEADELSFGISTRTHVMNVEDLADPYYVTFFTNGLASTDHNLMVRGGFAFEANYSSGLRIYDVSDVLTASEVGYFDTFPSHDSAGYSGAWGVFAGLPSGTVLISDQSLGLFVLNVKGAVGCLSDLGCHDGDPCTDDACLPNGTCDNQQLADGAACDDGDNCTINGQCDVAGDCIGTEINTIPCSDDAPCWPGLCDTDAGFCFCVTCTTVDPPTAELVAARKNRYFSLVPGNAGLSTALLVTLSSLPAPFAGFNGTQMWLGEPFTVSELSSSGGQTPLPVFTAARLTCEPVFWDWGSVGLVHVLGEAIVPGGLYSVQAINLGCYLAGLPSYSGPLNVETSMWGDAVGSCSVSPCTPPNGVVDFIDIAAVVDKFQSTSDAPRKARMDLGGNLPDLIIDFVDISLLVDAFRGSSYPFDGPSGCP